MTSTDTSLPSLKIKHIIALPLALLAFVAFLASLPLFFPAEVVSTTFAEYGMVETVNGYVWFLTALVVLRGFKVSPKRATVFALTFVLFGMREFDLHKAFTSDSILKTNFYEHGEGLEVIFGGIAAVIIIITLISVVWFSVEYFWKHWRTWSISVQLLFYGWGLLVFSKICDRLPGVAQEKFGITLSDSLRASLRAKEEGIELLVPLMMITLFTLFMNPLRPDAGADAKPSENRPARDG